MKATLLFAGICLSTLCVPLWPVSAEEIEAEAAVQAEVDTLTAGLLAGNFVPASLNGLKTDAAFVGPSDIAVDSSGNVFVADGKSIRKISPDGRVSPFAGSNEGFADGHGVTARFSTNLAIAIDADDNIYVTDPKNRKIRKITPAGYVSTLAGSTSGHRDGLGTDAQFVSPQAIAVDAAGNVYVGDYHPPKSTIRKITPQGEVTTLALGYGIVFATPRSLAVDVTGNIFVLDGNSIRKITTDGDVIMMAPDMTFDLAANMDYRADFKGRVSIAADSSGNLYVAAKEAKTLVKIAPDGHTTTIADYYNHWIGQPNGLAIGANGKIYLADEHNHVVHQITPAGFVGPLPGFRIPTHAQPLAEPTAPAAPAATEKELKALFKITQKNARKDVDAQFELAGMYRDQRGVVGGIGLAGTYFKKAAKGGHAGAQYEWGKLQLQPFFVSYLMSITNGDVEAAKAEQMVRRQAGAVEWYMKSADQGYAKAQDALAWAYLRGEGIAQSNEKAIEFFSLAGEQGDFDSQFQLGEIYRKGEMVGQDLNRAIEWYSLTAEQGDLYSAAVRNALISEQSDPREQIYIDADAQTIAGLRYYAGDEIEQDFTAALDSFEAAAMLGSTTAQWMLGVMYFNGEGVAPDREKSALWQTIAAELGHADAQFRLGFLYEKGYGVPQDTVRAIDWYVRSAEQENLNAQFSLGQLFYYGEGVQADHVASLAWYEMAANNGDAQSQYDVASMYFSGYGVPRNGAKAIDLFKQATAQGHRGAAALVPIFQKAESSDPSAEFTVGAIYRDGREVAKDDAIALTWFTRSAEQGYVEAQYALGVMYESCCGANDSDYTSAIAWLQIAANSGHVLAGQELENLLAQIDNEQRAEARLLLDAIEKLIRDKMK